MRTFFLVVGGLALGSVIGSSIIKGDIGTTILCSISLACHIGYIITVGIELGNKIKEIKNQVHDIKSFIKH